MNTLAAPLEHDNTQNDPTRRPVLVTGPCDLASITETVSRIVEQPAPRAWYLALMVCGLGTLVFFGLVAYLISTGIDWDWARGDADFGHPLSVPAEVAHKHQPGGRGDDAVRRHLRGIVPRHPRGADMGHLLAGALPESDGHLA